MDFETVRDSLFSGETCQQYVNSGMADQGMGIRLFKRKDELQRIFESFEEDSDVETKGENDDSTAVVTSQLRHFVIQVPFYLDVLNASELKIQRITFKIPYCWIQQKIWVNQTEETLPAERCEQFLKGNYF